MAENVSRQILAMESLDSRESADAIIALKSWIVDGHGIAQLVEYYAKHQSIRALELLCLVQEPYDKILLDKMLENMSKNRHGTLILMGRIVQKAPGWLPKFPHHCLFRTILESIQLNGDLEYVSAAILFITSILPYCTTLNEAILEQLFNTFTQTCDILISQSKTPKTAEEILANNLPLENGGEISPEKASFTTKLFVNRMHFDAMKFAVIKYFHALYALYPCNLIHFLRATNNSSSNFRKLIDDLFMTVRFHTALIFDSKSNELSRERWMTKEPHDFFILSRKLSANAEANRKFTDISSPSDVLCKEAETGNEINLGGTDDYLTEFFNSPLFAVKELSGFSSTLCNRRSGTISQSQCQPFLNSGLVTPPNALNENETNPNPEYFENSHAADIVLLQNDAIPLNSSGRSSLLQKIGGLFKPRASSALPIKKLSAAPNNDNLTKIKEYLGVCAEGGSLVTSPCFVGIQSVEWAIECTELTNSESSSNTRNNNTEDLNRMDDQPGTSNATRYNTVRRNVDYRTTSESSSKQLVATRKLLSTSQTLARATSLNNLNEIKGRSSKIASDRHHLLNIAKADKIQGKICENICSNTKDSSTLNLLQNVGEARQGYMNASIIHHLKLKELELADRFPGRMYDDMRHILKQLPVERQCEILSARLHLVNQHLLFERYCRLLHETRNRRLFGKLKQQRTSAAELENLKKSEHRISAALDKQTQLYAQLKRDCATQKSFHLQSEERFADELRKRQKENESITSELSVLRDKFERVNSAYKAERLRVNHALLQNENLMAERKLMDFELREINVLQRELARIQREKLYLEAELKIKNVAPNVGPSSRQRADEMVTPLYEAQLKNLRLHLRKTKMALSRAFEKNRIIESQWKEELDRRLDLQSTLSRASIVHSKNVEAATHKFNTLLAVCNKQEAHIFNLYRALENQCSSMTDIGVNGGSYSEFSEEKNVDASGQKVNSIPVSCKPNVNYGECDSSYIFSELEEHSIIADLFSPAVLPSKNITTIVDSYNSVTNSAPSKNPTLFDERKFKGQKENFAADQSTQLVEQWPLAMGFPPLPPKAQNTSASTTGASYELYGEFCYSNAAKNRKHEAGGSQQIRAIEVRSRVSSISSLPDDPESTTVNTTPNKSSGR